MVGSKMNMKNISFVDISDGSTLDHIQMLVTEEQVQSLSYGTCVAIDGKMIDSSGSKQRYELVPHRINILGLGNQQSNPLQPKQHSLEFLREIAHLRPRTNLFSSLLRLRNFASMTCHQYFQSNGFIQIHTPILTGNDCEGAGETFRVVAKDSSTGRPIDFFGNEAFLTVSGQLQAELFACSLSRVYSFGPTFRAEKSNTLRHLAEFWMVEPEIAFSDLDCCMKIAEQLVKHILKELLFGCEADIKFFEKWVDHGLLRRFKETIEKKFECVKYKEAIEILQRANNEFVFPIKYGSDLQREHEKYLTEIFYKKPVFIIDWPKEIKPFYMKMNTDGKTVASMDLLVPEVGELIGGSVRENDYEVLKERMQHFGLNQAGELNWYLDLRKFGSVPHSGFGMGFERLMLYVTGMRNIKDVMPLPRYYGYCKY